MAQRETKSRKKRVKFDTKVQHRDPRTGKILKETPYTLKFSKEHGTHFIRDGVKYHPDGSPVKQAPTKKGDEK